MPVAKKLSLTLDAELAAQVDDAVASGAYASATEVVEDALACWRERRALEADPETLRRLWQNGLASGEPEPLDMAEIKRAARARLLEEAAGRS
jgi:antitoxin ParD1/3/4